MSEMHWPEITKDTPITEVKRIHQAIWDYVIEHGDKPITPYYNDCVCCEYDSFYDDDCFACPIMSLTTTHCCDGLYRDWCNKDGDDKIGLAQQIRDLPFKYELEEKKNV